MTREGKRLVKKELITLFVVVFPPIGTRNLKLLIHLYPKIGGKKMP